MWCETLQAKRRELGLSYDALADKSGVPERTVIRTLTGETLDPGVATVKRIANALGLTLDELFDETAAIIGGERAKKMIAENAELAANLARLKDDLIAATAKAATLSAELERAEMRLTHQSETIELQRELIAALKAK